MAEGGDKLEQDCIPSPLFVIARRLRRRGNLKTSPCFPRGGGGLMADEGG